MRTFEPNPKYYPIAIEDKGDKCGHKRCPDPIFAYRLCERHHNEWTLQGRKPFITSQGDIIDPETLAPISGGEESPEAKALNEAEKAYTSIQVFSLHNPEMIARAKMIRDMLVKREALAQAQIERLAAPWRPVADKLRQTIDLLERRLVSAEQVASLPAYDPSDGHATADSQVESLAPTASGIPQARVKIPQASKKTARTKFKYHTQKKRK